LYDSPNIIWVIKSRRIRRVGHVARVGELKNTKKKLYIMVGKPEEKRTRET